MPTAIEDQDQDGDQDSDQDDDREGDEEEGEEQDPSRPSNALVFADWEALCSGISEQVATHYRYARFTTKRLRFCEGGRFFSLDADEGNPAHFPKPRSGDFRVILYRQEAGQPPRPAIADPDDPSLRVSVCFRGRLPASAQPEARAETFSDVQLRAYKERLHETAQLQERLQRYYDSGWEKAEELKRENKRLKKKLKRARQEIEEKSGGILGLVRELLAHRDQIKGALEEAKPFVADAISMAAAMRPPRS